MDIPREQAGKARPPSRASGGWFVLKRSLLILRRLAEDRVHPPRRFPKSGSSLSFVVEKRSPLYRETDAAEVRLELGKVQNLRLAAQALDGVEVPAGETFSFWRQVGKCTRRRGYAVGRQLQEGCLMPAVGGGICQFTNALYAAALDAGLEIVERHPHTRAVPGAVDGRDATVAWNYIDLRLRSDRPFRVETRLTSDELIVGIATERKGAKHPLRVVDGRMGANSCATCGQDGCHHWHEIEREGAIGRTAFLVDQWIPEWEACLPIRLTPEAQGLEASETHRLDGDAKLAKAGALLFRPLNGERWKRPGYLWPSDRFAEVRDFTLLALRRGFGQRKLADQGAARQKALLEGAEELAQAYSRALAADVRHVIVSQELLPFLWRNGVLGGRTFDVLMSRLPMAEIQRRLDEAAARHPERKLLSDFRAPGATIEAESEALAQAGRQITCHPAIARAVSRPLLVDWKRPLPMKWTPGHAIVFPGPTAARKGAYEVRDAARQLDLEVVLLGSELEGDGFWDGVRVRRMSRSDNWLEGVLAVVQPAILEDRPIALLRAVASGCPVIASEACGIDEAIVVESGDVEGLVKAIVALGAARQVAK